MKKTDAYASLGADRKRFMSIIDKTKCAGIQNQMRLFGG